MADSTTRKPGRPKKVTSPEDKVINEVDTERLEMSKKDSEKKITIDEMTKKWKDVFNGVTSYDAKYSAAVGKENSGIKATYLK